MRINWFKNCTIIVHSSFLNVAGDNDDIQSTDKSLLIKQSSSENKTLLKGFK